MSKTSNQVRWIGRGAGAAALFGLGRVAVTWYRYGRVAKHGKPATLLDRFLPSCEVLERHQTRVAAPVESTYAAARAMNLMRSRLVQAIFRGRELVMRAEPTDERAPQSLVDEVLALGWGVLAQEPGRDAGPHAQFGGAFGEAAATILSIDATAVG